MFTYYVNDANSELFCEITTVGGIANSLLYSWNLKKKKKCCKLNELWECDLLKSIHVQLSDALVFKPQNLCALLHPWWRLRNIIRENRLDSDSPHALSQLIIVSRITKKDICSVHVQWKKNKKSSHNSQWWKVMASWWRSRSYPVCFFMIPLG